MEKTPQPRPPRDEAGGDRRPAIEQVSAGGVAFRRTADGVEVALISVGPKERWQLPKGLLNAGETAERAAIREVREETGIETRMLAPIRTIEYWYVGDHRGRRARFHKRVHFFLLAYVEGDVSRHDHEVNEARWFPPASARSLLAFKSEREVLDEAVAMRFGEPPASSRQ